MFSIEKIPSFILYPLTILVLVQAMLTTYIELKLNTSDNVDEISIVSKATYNFKSTTCNLEKQRMLERAAIVFLGDEGAIASYKLGHLDCQEFNHLVSDIDKRVASIWTVKFGWYVNDVQLQVGGKVISGFDKYKEGNGIVAMGVLTLVMLFMSFIKWKKIYTIGGIRL